MRRRAKPPLTHRPSSTNIRLVASQSGAVREGTHEQAGPALLLALHVLSVSSRRLRPKIRYRLGDGAERLWDSEKSRGLYREYIEQLAYADELGFDGMVLNEHHQNIYGLMPSPNLIAAALAQRTRHGKIVILGNLLPLHLNPLRMAEEYAMLDNMSDGRLIAGFAPGAGPRPSTTSSLGAVARAVLGGRRSHPARLDGRRSVRLEGRHYPMRYVNPWPRPTQTPHPPIWIPSRARPKPWSTSPGAAIASSCRRAATAAKPRNHSSSSRRSWRITATASPVSHGHPAFGLCGGDRRASASRGQGRNLVLPQELPQGTPAARGPPTDRRAGHPLHPALGVPQLSEILRPHDAAARRRRERGTISSDPRRSSSAVPETVYRRIIDIVEHAKVGHLFIQFHMGNMADALTRKSMRLFAAQVAPRLREDSASCSRSNSRFGAAAPEMAP